MYKLVLTKQFSEAALRLNLLDKSAKPVGDLKVVLDKLQANQPLPAKYRDHKLKYTRQYPRGARDWHLKFDIVLVYRYDHNQLILECLNIGPHSKVFSSEELHYTI